MRLWVCMLLIVGAGLAPAQANEAAAWRALSQPGHALLVRHANAPGTGDPDHFELSDCTTQRNLDAGGRRQARRIGHVLRHHGVVRRPVYTSQWCRARETAELLGVGSVESFAGLNSFFGEMYEQDDVMPALRAFLRERRLDPPPVLVTHQVNITALTGVFPAEGEMVVIAVADTGAVRVVGRLSPDAE